MSNIFESKDQAIGGAFTAENCTLDLGAGIQKAIVQRVQFNIERPINFVYEISHPKDANQFVYYVGGRRRGQATFERIVGGSGTFKAFIDGYGPLCSAPGANIVLEARGGCPIGATPELRAASPVTGGKGIKYTLKTPKISALGAAISAQDIVITETVTMLFLDLQYDEVDGAGGATPAGPSGAVRPGPGGAIA